VCREWRAARLRSRCAAAPSKARSPCIARPPAAHQQQQQAGLLCHAVQRKHVGRQADHTASHLVAWRHTRQGRAAGGVLMASGAGCVGSGGELCPCTDAGAAGAMCAVCPPANAPREF
jgi:hypothetical protein